jgi:hypothetical protein
VVASTTEETVSMIELEVDFLNEEMAVVVVVDLMAE